MRQCSDINTEKIIEDYFYNTKIEDYQKAEFEKLGFSPSKKMAIEKLTLSDKLTKPNSKYI